MRTFYPWFELLIWLALALAAFALTFQFSAEPGSYRWGAASWPRAILLLMAVFAVAQFLLHRKPSSKEEGSMNRPATTAAGNRIQLIATFVLPLIYLALLPKAGFYLSTPLFLLAFLWILGERRWPYLIGVPLLIYVLINLLFTRLFYVALPTGSWPGFYDFSNWLIVLIR
jgi:hypothetical protein